MQMAGATLSMTDASSMASVLGKPSASASAVRCRCRSLSERCIVLLRATGARAFGRRSAWRSSGLSVARERKAPRWRGCETAVDVASEQLDGLALLLVHQAGEHFEALRRDLGKECHDVLDAA